MSEQPAGQGQPAGPSQPTTGAAPEPASRGTVSSVTASSAVSAAVAAPANLDVILDIELPLSVRFGQAELTLDALTRLGPGTLIELSRAPDDPVEILVNGKMIARGEVVVVGGNYGVRISEIASKADRLRSVGHTS